MVLKSRKLIYHRHIVVKGKSAFLHKPLNVLTVDDVDICGSGERRKPFLCRSDNHAVPQILQMLPLFDFSRPGITSHTQRRYYQDLMHFKAVEKQVVYRRQSNARLAKTHIKQKC